MRAQVLFVGLMGMSLERTGVVVEESGVAAVVGNGLGLRVMVPS